MFNIFKSLVNPCVNVPVTPASSRLVINTWDCPRLLSVTLLKSLDPSDFTTFAKLLMFFCLSKLIFFFNLFYAVVIFDILLPYFSLTLLLSYAVLKGFMNKVCVEHQRLSAGSVCFQEPSPVSLYPQSSIFTFSALTSEVFHVISRVPPTPGVP